MKYVLIICILFIAACGSPSAEIDENTDAMVEHKNELDLKNLKSDLDDFCTSLCAEARNSIQDQENFCLGYAQAVDVNQNGAIDFTSRDLDFTNGYCEDRIYCAVYKPCGNLDLDSCIEKFDNADQYEAGSCFDGLSVSDQEKHWISRLN